VTNNLFITCSTYLLRIVFSFVIGYEMRKPQFKAKLLAMRSEFPRAANWVDQILKSKWTQAYDEGKMYRHIRLPTLPNV